MYLDAWQQFINETNGIGGDGAESLPRSQSVSRNQSKTFAPMVCLEPHGVGFALFVPDDLPAKERLINGLSGLDWVVTDGPLFLFPANALEKMIYLTSNYDVRWGIPEYLRGQHG